MRSGRRWAAASVLLALAMPVLSGCSARYPAAIRVNFDGTIDHMACTDGDPVPEWSAGYTTSRREPDSNGGFADLVPTAPLAPYRAGQVVHFERPLEPWVSVGVRSGRATFQGVDADDIWLGEWMWSDEGALFGPARGEGEHCDAWE